MVNPWEGTTLIGNFSPVRTYSGDESINKYKAMISYIHIVYVTNIYVYRVYISFTCTLI